MARYHIAMRQMPVITGNHPAVIDKYVALLGESLHGQQGTVVQPVLTVLRLAASRNTNAVTARQCQGHWPVDLKPVGKSGRKRSTVSHAYAASLREAWCILLKLNKFTRRVGFLGIRQMRRIPTKTLSTVTPWLYQANRYRPRMSEPPMWR